MLSKPVKSALTSYATKIIKIDECGGDIFLIEENSGISWYEKEALLKVAKKQQSKASDKLDTYFKDAFHKAVSFTEEEYDFLNILLERKIKKSETATYETIFLAVDDAKKNYLEQNTWYN